MEAQYAVGSGFSVYGNASYNSAEYKDTNVWVADSPRDTAALGVLYDDRTGPYGSLIGKVIGPHWGLDNTSDANGNVVFGNQYHINSQFTADLAVGWNFHNVEGWMKDLGVSLKVGNLFNNRGLADFAGNQSATNAPLYWFVAGRSVFNLTTSF